ncbi:MAG: hypothetical protein PHV56_04265 [Clostridia bacterium]|nr:hypothetical protein [Clostridia bacterium]
MEILMINTLNDQDIYTPAGINPKLVITIQVQNKGSHDINIQRGEALIIIRPAS